MGVNISDHAQYWHSYNSNFSCISTKSIFDHSALQARRFVLHSGGIVKKIMKKGIFSLKQYHMQLNCLHCGVFYLRSQTKQSDTFRVCHGKRARESDSKHKTIRHPLKTKFHQARSDIGSQAAQQPKLVDWEAEPSAGSKQNPRQLFWLVENGRNNGTHVSDR